MSSLPKLHQFSNLESEKLDEKHLRADLLKVLTDIESKKTPQFAVGAVTTELPSIPGLTITEYGVVSLPVTDATVKDLKEHFKQACSGLGEASLIDKDFWELDAKQFKITNSKFTTGVGKLVMEIKEELGCANVHVFSHLCKLILHSPGGYFKPYQDTSKHPGIFATLIIQLPSIFSGGDLVVKHNSKEKRIKFSTKDSEFFCFYTAHFAVCEHELMEIKSGYRMALVYSLCWDGNGAVPSPPDHPANRLAGLFQHFDKAAPHGFLAWGLDHQCFESSFLNKGVEGFKEGDKLTYSSLQDANDLLDDDKKLDFLIVGAKRIDNMFGECSQKFQRVHRSMKGKCFKEYECEREFEYDIIGMDGKKWKTNGFEMEVFDDVLNFGDNDDKFWGGCNEGECSDRYGIDGYDVTYKTNWYMRYALLIFPKGCSIKVAFCGYDMQCNAVYYLEDLLETTQDTPSVKMVASDILDLLKENMESFMEDMDCQKNMLKLLLRVKDLELIKKLLLLLSEPLDSNLDEGFGIPDDKVISLLKDLITTFGWEALTDPLTKLIESCPIKYFNNVAKFMEQCPKDVPTDQLMMLLVQKGMRLLSKAGGNHLRTENIKELGLYIVSHPQTCSQFKEAYFNSLEIQNLKRLTRMMSILRWSWYSNKDNNAEFCQMIIAKFCEKVHTIEQEGQDIFYEDSSNIAEGVTDLYRMQEENQFKEVVEDVVQIRSAYLLDTLVSHFEYFTDLSEPVKRLFKARIDQLLHIVQAGEPKEDWRRPTAVFPGHPKVEAFMRGPGKTFHYKKFKDRRQAQRFERDYLKKESNVFVRVKGSWNNTVVEITKLSANKFKYNQALEKFRRDCAQLKSLQGKLDVASTSRGQR